MRLAKLVGLEAAKLAIAGGLLGSAALMWGVSPGANLIALGLGAFGAIGAGALVWSWLIWLWRWQMAEMVYFAGDHIDREVERRVDEYVGQFEAETIVKLADERLRRLKPAWAQAFCDEAGLSPEETASILEAVREDRIFPVEPEMAA